MTPITVSSACKAAIKAHHAHIFHSWLFFVEGCLSICGVARVSVPDELAAHGSRRLLEVCSLRCHHSRIDFDSSFDSVLRE